VAVVVFVFAVVLVVDFVAVVVVVEGWWLRGGLLGSAFTFPR